MKLKVVIIMMMCGFMATALRAKTIKDIKIADGEVFTDHIALAKDATDKDLMVKFIFNEQENTLCVSVISFRTLFVFWEDTPYRHTINCRRQILPDRLPYIVAANPQDRFRLSKDFWRTIPQPRKKYLFHRWIEYDGLQPQPAELKMVCDSIRQKFDIQNRRTEVVVRLRDILLMDAVRQRNNATDYDIVFGRDLDTEYRLALDRNPCFGLDEEITAARNTLAAITKSYNTFRSRYAKGTVTSDDGLALFHELQATLVAQFPRNNERSNCTAIQQLRDSYNLFADSIAALRVVIEQTPVIVADEPDTKERARNAKVIMANARQIDNLVARWLVSTDIAEREDIISQCQSILRDTKAMLQGRALNKEEREAVAFFQQAEKYFNRTCR